MGKRITYKDINEKYSDIEARLGEIESKLNTTRSDWINFLICRIEEINEDSRTIYSSFWVKFSFMFSLIFAISSVVLAVGSVAGIESTIKILGILEEIIWDLVIIFFLSVVMPFIVGFVNYIKQNECYDDYQNILSKIMFGRLENQDEIIDYVEKAEKKRSCDLESYVLKKLKKEWSEFRKLTKRHTKKL